MSSEIPADSQFNDIYIAAVRRAAYLQDPAEAEHAIAEARKRIEEEYKIQQQNPITIEETEEEA